ncbi:helix-turn-helix domain-containing protein [Solitalea sp. MAHUQ-68]|uniref:Helix-turn-helix domain-containing protein n=1 Tax=Solitalea agri TaxID=2953739 RepID=A0A9X2EZ49_9SPHI|nr:helix-turn-helix domain-containing protein [Solitalea agri]MCO4291704.1 helix-turn-helix domain-containing protein [Solitalea agri]
MKRLIILVPDGNNNLSSIAGAHKILKRANDYYKNSGHKEVFAIQLAGVSEKVECDDGLFTIKPELNIEDVKKADLIIIPSLDHNYERTIKLNRAVIEWLYQQYKMGAEMASICTGAFLLAETGLLDGKSCSTHWIAADVFKKQYPKINLLSEKLITDEHGIYTNGGAFSFLNLMLYLIEKYFDRQTAIYCSKVFQIDIDRDSQSAFTIFTGQKDHNDEAVKKAQLTIENHFRDKISFELMANDLAISRRNFDRRFIKATGNSPLEYHQRVKIEAAKRSFENSGKNINEVMFDVGYNDSKAFRTIFKKITGLAPIEYRNKYNKMAYSA